VFLGDSITQLNGADRRPKTSEGTLP
jgi:hypothetical protein